MHSQRVASCTRRQPELRSAGRSGRMPQLTTSATRAGSGAAHMLTVSRHVPVMHGQATRARHISHACILHGSKQQGR